MNQKGSALVLLLGGLALIFAALAGYFYLQTQKTTSDTTVPVSQVQPIDEMASWKTHIDADYDFSIKYPENWYLRERPSIIINRNPMDNSEIYTHRLIGSFTISVVPFKESSTYYSDEGDPVIEDFIVDGVRGKKIKQRGRNAIGDGPFTSVIVSTKKYTYYLVYDSDKLGNADFIFDQILSTFKFL